MQVEYGRVFVGRFPYQSDLVRCLEELCKKNSIQLATFSIIGAVSKVVLGYYDQDKKQYVECARLDKKLEITSCLGNVSLKEKNISVHAHVQLADHHGHCFGGHLMPGSFVFAAEYCLQELTCGILERMPDPQTGLPLWPQ